MKKIVYIVLLALAVAATAACHRRPLHDMEERIALKVTIDVDTVCNVGRYIYNDQIPVPNTNTDMLRVFLYDHETHKQIAQTFISDKSYDEAGHQVISGLMNIRYGTYDFLIYNFDTPNTLIKDENGMYDITAYTQDLSGQVRDAIFGSADAANAFPGDKLSEQPDHLMVAREQGFYIPPHTQLETLETTAYTCINTYYIQIRVIGLRFVNSCNAVVSGLYSGNKFGCDATSPWTVGQRIGNPETATYFTMIKSTDKNIQDQNQDVLCAVFNTFGKIEDSNSDLYVTFNLIDTEGNKLRKTVNLNSVFRTENARERHWLLLEDIWEIDDPIPHPVNGGGFVPVVDDWDEEYAEIDL